jgi:hypothetical protein
LPRRINWTGGYKSCFSCKNKLFPFLRCNKNLFSCNKKK